ncbi:hypothetical protein O1611_g2990 [Lasiodiplodia mahajangana]|uniref:Uncharacterized protein n=1 Tax=Lasiodiplodia mahajangana TaxID=1108764 RepID=A0ACC2JTI3_9PEZI|nr:hypothetical protein O1611_g2990 [Lasiodiplodia mahajangana]
MGTRGLEIFRFRGRYYIYWHQFDSDYEELGARIVASIPADPEEYKKWLLQMRAKFAAKESALEEHVYEIRDGSKPDYSYFDSLMALPSELPRLDAWSDVENVYIINLDCEVLTMNFGIHWKLGNIPRTNNLWLRAICDSIYKYKHTVSLDMCPDEHLASPALELREPDPYLDYEWQIVTPKLDISEARKAFLTRVLAKVLVEYHDGFFSFPAQICNPRECQWFGCESNHIPKSCGFLDKEWAGDHAPLLEFGSMAHRPGDAPGVSPAETMYWLEDVLVSLTLRHDCGAVMAAVTWGLDQGRDDFQIVILSLFQVSFAEFTRGKHEGDEPLIKLSDPIYLSPLRQKYCMSTHPRERPEQKGDMEIVPRRGELLMRSNCTGTVRRLQSQFPGLAALVNFFEVAANRRVASKSAGILPPEIYDLILEFVDYETWRTCASVSTAFRSACLRKYRVDEKTSIVAGPAVRLQKSQKEPLLSFRFEDMKTGQAFQVVEVPSSWTTKELNWMPLIGKDRKALMLNVSVQFELAKNIPVEDNTNNELL